MTPANSDRQSFRNEDLVLQVSPAVDRSIWDDSQYELFLDELCGSRNYQKEAIQTALRYMLGGEYADLQQLAYTNFELNSTLHAKYGSWTGFKQRLQFPDILSASLDLATGTGKSYILYGIALIMLASGEVDQVLVLCPSTTIELGLLDKFRELAGNADLKDLLPPDSAYTIPEIISADQTITPGSICVENYHAILERTGSSIRDSLLGKGNRTLILNDETHHVANEPASQTKRWKEFLADKNYGFKYIIGVSGTCYVGDDYFADVIYRYSLRQAMEERRVKNVKYVAEMPKTKAPDEQWQLIHNHHVEIRRKLKKHRIVPLTIIVTKTISRCKDLADELKAFLVDSVGLTKGEVNERVLVVYNNAPDVARLPYVDLPSSKVEWIISVSMLNEGWDVKRVFQIVPHEERAFNSKLLISQVLGRGLRVPENWSGEQAEVTVFNHEAWASRIKHLVDEVLEIERRLSSRVLADSPYHFELHQINTRVESQTITTKPKEGPYKLFDGREYINLADDVETEDIKIEFERAGSYQHSTWQTQIHRKTYTPHEIAEAMYSRLLEAQNPTHPDPAMRTNYTDEYPVERLEQIVKKSLELRGMEVATERMRQKLLSSIGIVFRGATSFARFVPVESDFFTISTSERQSDSVSAAELRRTKTFFFTDQTRNTLKDEQVEFFDTATERASGYRCYLVDNRNDFKTPLNAAIADSENERKFIKELIDPQNVTHYMAWIKSRAVRFYEIDYTWRKGTHPKYGKFSPDFLIKVSENLILVVEIKDDSEILEPDEENKAKNRYTIEHFKRVNERLDAEDAGILYQFNFLTPTDFNVFFQKLRGGEIQGFNSALDVKLIEGNGN
jgi:type III restriction enzyme